MRALPPLARLALPVAAALVVTAGPACAPGYAAPGAGLEVSHDGSHFSRAHDSGLFTDLGRVVPGSRGKDSVWFRNGTEQRIRLRLQLSDGWTESAPLARATTLTVKGPGDSRSTRLGGPLASGDCTVVSPDYVLRPGSTLRLDAEVAISTDLTGREGALKSLGFSLKAFAADADVALPAGCGVALPKPGGESSDPPPAPGKPQAAGPPLAQAGFGSGLLAASGAALAGLGLLLARRRGKHST